MDSLQIELGIPSTFSTLELLIIISDLPNTAVPPPKLKQICLKLQNSKGNVSVHQAVVSFQQTQALIYGCKNRGVRETVAPLVLCAVTVEQGGSSLGSSPAARNPL